ncbi:Spx/MgsR family RNA polymerase-binding regulatory protein [Helicobacter saguini]|uniref:Spx/MgsR family RNA polymerase-binding regulatory protein n=1 Tax=Helicobacter saguini TaxID=1548018 RepID=A0A347VPS8_9HELI|nr:Spx/MgsR family RNA polymerase-binding regulatory protein [Helicobacter saguini]MWV61234.1 Spx/MgsR family RNA polymerase-binding regulatory protein [Helicobacter saguini]MWV68099.1 Spx/MgsR family RNA polymerase-binding regulatory protein [Helicobacter saguini]MWV70437.1 Spx/MgsR family RNA polymerase-binding regulatory protein [Helicobacter saguini]MWV72338.1 Spx/MgsR family RNA polymerase-binding regulatory protein [Helicobacter saguini]TLD92986.1 Spx/MgsR family RNA polymerase-binding r
MIKIYGIKNCNSMKKAFVFLDNLGIKYEFVDFKKCVISKEFVEKIINLRSIESVVNTKGTTFRKLKDFGLFGDLSGVNAEIIASNPALIKRPLIVKFSKDCNLDSIESVFIGLNEMEKLKA